MAVSRSELGLSLGRPLHSCQLGRLLLLLLNSELIGDYCGFGGLGSHLALVIGRNRGRIELLVLLLLMLKSIRIVRQLSLISDFAVTGRLIPDVQIAGLCWGIGLVVLSAVIF
jgi:hypothetical protein